MRTSIDLPEALFYRLDPLAAEQGSTLEELIIRCVELGLREAPGSLPDSPPRQRSPLPLVRAPTGKPLPDLGTVELQAVLDGDDPPAE